MNAAAAVFLRLILSVWNAWYRHRYALILSVVVATLSIASSVILMNGTETQEVVSAEDHAAEVLNRYPEGAAVIGDRLVHRCTDGDSVKKIAQAYYSYTRIFIREDFRQRLEAENRDVFRKRSSCAAGSEVVIPEPLLEPLTNHPLKMDGPVQAIYLRGENAVPGRLSAEIKRLKRSGGNGVVFDVKDILGVVNYASSVAEVEQYRRHPAPIPDLPKMIDFLHRQGIYVIARTAMFQDMNLSQVRPELAIPDRNSPTGKLLFKGKPLWVDPGHPDVQMYNLKIIHELVEMGVDEIQLDYIRYPAEGDLSGVSYFHVRNSADKTEHIRKFLSTAWIFTKGAGVRLGIDVFGVVAWGEEADRNTTGQRLEAFAPYIDVVSPMLYPSHFNFGFDGFPKPADEPVYFYATGGRKVRSLVGPNVIVRPWLQAFKWRVSNYNERYIQREIEGNRAGGGEGWMMWNAGNDYDVVYRALGTAHSMDLVQNGVLQPQRKVD